MKKVWIVLALVTLLVGAIPVSANTLSLSGGALYGSGSGAQKNTSLAIYGSVNFEVFPKFVVEADGLFGTARSIGSSELGAFQSLTQQIFQLGAAYMVEEDLDFRAFAGGGVMVFSHQYRSGESGGSNDNVSSVGPYAKLGVQASPEPNVSLGGQVAYSPWASGGAGESDDQATLMRLSAFLNYYFTDNFAVQGTVIRTSHNQPWGLSTTWFGLGVGVSF